MTEQVSGCICLAQPGAEHFVVLTHIVAVLEELVVEALGALQQGTCCKQDSQTIL